MPNHKQSVRSLPCIIQPFLLQHTHGKKERILILFKTITPISIKNTCYMVKIGDYIWFFQDHYNSFQDHCLNHYKFNILASIWFKSSQNKVQPLNFKFSNSIVSIVPIVCPYEQIWQSVKNTHTQSAITSTIRAAGS